MDKPFFIRYKQEGNKEFFSFKENALKHKKIADMKATFLSLDYKITNQTTFFSQKRGMLVIKVEGEKYINQEEQLRGSNHV
jgi:hypothetical protein